MLTKITKRISFVLKIEASFSVNRIKTCIEIAQVGVFLFVYILITILIHFETVYHDNFKIKKTDTV